MDTKDPCSGGYRRPMRHTARPGAGDPVRNRFPNHVGPPEADTDRILLGGPSRTAPPTGDLTGGAAVLAPSRAAPPGSRPEG